MNKDYNLKKDPHFSSDHLRERVSDSVKGWRDETEELDIPQAKTIWIIPVTGSSVDEHKYLSNKSKKAY